MISNGGILCHVVSGLGHIGGRYRRNISGVTPLTIRVDRFI